jgi:uncharacterized protein YjbJ (UPF0337 family)
MVIGFGPPSHAGTASPSHPVQTDQEFRVNPNLLLVINQDQFAGNWKQFKGELKRKWGEFTDDDLLYIEGSYDKYEGKLQERYGDRREEVKQWADEWFKQHDFEQSKDKNVP